MVKNRAKVALDIQMAITRLEEAPIALYRQVVWQIFERIVMQTPQYSGRAVANWNLGINSPDMSFDPGMGDDLELTGSGYVNNKVARERGDMKWASEALDRAKYVLRRIRRGDKVFITNATRGDTDDGQSSAAYLADLQRPGYWAKKLRAQNQPYETAMESAVLISEGLLDAGTMPIGGLNSNI
ncbi:hypothetical protein J7E62_31005 [Variovorax paradoxus]|nr:hypothetical protein [Variovorax paradoxus]